MATGQMTRIDDLQPELVELLGSNNVYFQPPESLKLKYPCIVYELNRIDKLPANNLMYRADRSYSVTLIHQDPDNDIVDKMLQRPLSSFDRAFVSDNLHHFVFTFYLRRK